MLLKKKLVFKTASLLFLLFYSLSVFSFSVKELNSKILDKPESFIEDIQISDKGSDLFFKEDLEDIISHRLQFAINRFSKEQILISRESIFDIDNLHSRLDSNGVISVAKAVFLFPNAQAQSFNIERVSDLEYCKIAFNDDEREKIDAQTVCSYKKYFLKTISAKVRFEEFDFLRNKGRGLSRKKALAFSALSNSDSLPQLIISTFSNEEDISLGSYGNRTINLYYNTLNNKVLLVSFKIVSFKNEKAYSSLFLKPLNIWGSILSKIESSQKNGTKDSLLNIVRFMNNE